MIPVSGETRQAPGRAQAGPGLHIVSTPIGNLRDITLRALDVLSSVNEVLAEDTRNARKLFDAHAIHTKVTAYHDHNGAERRPELLKRLAEGASLALISDAGTPLVSDPGWKLVKDALEAGIHVSPVPGASALLAGLVVSGLPSDRFLFAGFLPAKSGARRKVLQDLASVPATLVFYESGPRLAACLADMSDVLGAARPGAVTRELTKLFEESRRAALGDLAAHYQSTGGPKGEIVVLAGPPTAPEKPSQAELDDALQTALQTQPTKVAASEIAARFNLPRREVYERALHLKSSAHG